MAQQNTGASQLAQLTRPGALNGGNDPRALYLKLFSGEMFKGFQHNAIARDLVMKRTLKNGKIFTVRLHWTHKSRVPYTGK